MLQRRSYALVLVAAVLLCQFAVAQSNIGQIAGRVTDSTGSVVPGCTITSTNTGTGIVLTTRTDASGEYIFPSLPPTTFNIRAEAAGFRPSVQNGVILDAASKRTISFELQVGTVQETLEVTASAAQVQAESGEVSKVIYDKQLSDIALNGRNYTQMLRLVPGAVSNTLNSFDVALSSTAQNINGVRYNSTYFSLDGAENLDNGSNSNAIVSPSMDSIAEIRILTSSYSAEFGGRSGSTVNVVTKNGTKSFHGTLFEFVRNDTFDARSFFAAAVPPLHFNDFGWTLGGPVIFPGTSFNKSRNKLFFFAAQEQKYVHEGTTNVGSVPTALERQGNFQGSTLAAPKDPTNNQPFPNAIVPANRFSVNGPKLLSPIPLPNFSGPGGNYSVSAANRSDTREDLIRIDYYINSKNQLMYRWTHDTWAIWNAFQGTTLGFVPGARPRPGYSTILSLNTTINPTTLNYVSLSIMDNHIKAAPDDSLVSRSTLGLTYPEIFSPHQYTAGPIVNIAGYTGYNPGDFIKNLNTTFKANDDVSKIVGPHSLKFGVEIIRSRKNQNNSGGNEYGTVTFNTSSTLTSGNVLADALLGNFYTYTEGQTDLWWWSRYSSYEFYAQDSWRVSPRLSLDYGLRYNDIQHTTNGLGTWTMFIPSGFNPANAPSVSRTDGSLAAGTGNPYNGISLCGSGFPSAAQGRVPQASNSALASLFTGLPDACVKNPKNNWGPRLGFSFSPTAGGKTAIRGGIGIFYDVIETDEYSKTSANPPFSNSATIYNGNIDNPGGATFRNFPAALGALDSTLPNPRIMTYNLDVQRELPSNVILSVGYVGTLGRHLLRTLNINQLPVGTLTLAANKGVNANALVPYQGYGAINMIETGDDSNYNALQVSASKRYSKGLSYGVSYSFSKTLDTTAGQGTAPQNSYNAVPDYGLSSINRKNVLNFNYVYELPWLRQAKSVLARYVLGGWNLSGVTAFQAGAPNSLTVSSDVAGIGASSSRASVTGNPNFASGDRTLSQWFNTSVVVNPSLMTAGQFGNSGRDILTGPGFSQWDISLLKDFVIKEKSRFQFRAETFNTFNHPSFTGINTTVKFDTKGAPASGFGAVNAAGPGRMLEFGLKLLF
jgi:hypothetical protein